MPSKFCSACGAATQPGKKFCASCGAPLETNDTAGAAIPQQSAPSAPQSTYSQQQAPQPVYPRQQTPPPYGHHQQSPVAVKKRKKWPLILGGVAGLFILVLAGAFVAVGNTANADYYKLGKDKIPSIKLVVDKRSVSKVETATSGGVTTRMIAYEDVKDPTEDLTEYVHYLIDNEDFLATTDYNPDVIPGSAQLAKASADKGKIVLLDIAYDKDGYTLVITKSKGTLKAK